MWLELSKREWVEQALKCSSRGSFYINTSQSTPTFALGTGMQKMDFANFVETNSDKDIMVQICQAFIILYQG